jgi:hypothetical protein
MDEVFRNIQGNILTLNSIFMLIHQVRISEALVDIRDRLGRKGR